MNSLQNLLRKSLNVAALGSLLCTASLAHDTWVAEVTFPVSVSLSAAVSDGGKIALIRDHNLNGTDISILTANGANFSDFRISPSLDGRIAVWDALFLGEATLVLGGSLDGRPYMGAFQIGTGQPIWEKSLTVSGEIQRMTRNSIGMIIGTGNGSGGGYNGLVCAVNPSGGWSWFRYYNPGSSHNWASDMIPAPDGDMFLLSTGHSGFAISRVTDWGHEVWSKWIENPHYGIGSVTGCINAAGDLIVSGLYNETSNIIENCLVRISPAGDIVWANRYEIPNLNGNNPWVGSALPTSDGGVTLGWRTYDGADSAPAIVRVASDGQVVWARDFSGGEQAGRPIIMRANAGGYVSVFRSGADSAFVHRMDEAGFSGSCADSLFTVNVTPATVTTTDFTYQYETYPGAIGSLQTETTTTTSQVSFLCASTDTVGTVFCDPANPNSTGMATSLTGAFTSISGTGLHLDARRGPAGQFGYFLIGTGVNEAGTIVGQGKLCLSLAPGEQFGRYNVAGTNMNSIGQFNAFGVLENQVATSSTGIGFDVPLALPGIGNIILSGQTWHFQLWHRESDGHSNLSNGISVNF